MRHVGSLLAGLFLAPVAWLLLALGQQQSVTTTSAWVHDNAFDTFELIGPVAYLAAAGILVGLLATLRISPLGPLVAGLLLVIVPILMFIEPLATLDVLPDRIRRLGITVQPEVPVVNGTLVFVGMALIMAAFSAQRWRRWPAATPETSGTPATPASAALGPAAGAAPDADSETPAAMHPVAAGLPGSGLPGSGPPPIAFTPPAPTPPIPEPRRPSAPAPPTGWPEDAPLGDAPRRAPSPIPVWPVGETPRDAPEVHDGKRDEDEPPPSPWTAPPRSR